MPNRCRLNLWADELREGDGFTAPTQPLPEFVVVADQGPDPDRSDAVLVTGTSGVTYRLPARALMEVYR